MLSAQSTFLKYKITICQRTSSLYLPQRAARLLIFRAQNTEKLQLPMYPAAHSITTSTWVLAKGRRIRFKETNLALPCSSQLLVFRHLFLQCSIPFAEKENSSANRGWIFFCLFSWERTMSRWYCRYTTALGTDFGNALDTAECGIDTIALGQGYGNGWSLSPNRRQLTKGRTHSSCSDGSVSETA